MKKNRKSLNKSRVFLFAFSSIATLCIACVWGYQGRWNKFILFLTLFVVVSMHLSTSVLCYRLDERFDRLEELLKNKAGESADEEKLNDKSKDI